MIGRTQKNFILFTLLVGMIISSKFSDAKPANLIKNQEDLRQRFERALLCKEPIDPHLGGYICKKSHRNALEKLGLIILENTCKVEGVPGDEKITYQLKFPIQLLGFMVNKIVYYPINGGNHYVLIEVKGDIKVQAKKMNATIAHKLWHPLSSIGSDLGLKGPIYSPNKAGDGMAIFLGGKDNKLTGRFMLGCVEPQ